ncbi:MAG: DegV family protein [Oscillospiraceae bacterium]
MTDYIVMTDSNADLTPELVKQLGIKIISTEYALEGKTYLNMPDHSEYDFHTFYEKLKVGIPSKTSLINVDRYLGEFEPELKKGNDVLYICFSSALSGSFNCAKLAAEELREKYPERKIFAVDSLSASGGEGLLVYTAVQQKKNGLSIDELAKWVEDNRNHLCHWFTVDDLDHLKRGGRISSAAAFFGGMLSIKPVLHVDDEGRLIPMQKVRGRKAALDALVSEMEKTAVNPEEQLIYVCHADREEDCDYVIDLVKKRFKVKDIKKGHIGPVIGTHSGPGTIALFYFGTHK